jgi:hypothetical protein
LHAERLRQWMVGSSDYSRDSGDGGHESDGCSTLALMTSKRERDRRFGGECFAHVADGRGCESRMRDSWRVGRPPSVEMLMDQPDRHRALADRGRDSLDRAAAHVADREHARA